MADLVSHTPADSRDNLSGERKLGEYELASVGSSLVQDHARSSTSPVRPCSRVVAVPQVENHPEIRRGSRDKLEGVLVPTTEGFEVVAHDLVVVNHVVLRRDVLPDERSYQRVVSSQARHRRLDHSSPVLAKPMLAEEVPEQLLVRVTVETLALDAQVHQFAWSQGLRPSWSERDVRDVRETSQAVDRVEPLHLRRICSRHVAQGVGQPF